MLDALGVEKFVITGHDWGGWVAQLVALRVPERVTRIAILNMVPVWGDARRTLPQAWRFGHVLLNASPKLGAAWQRAGFVDRALLGVPAEDRPVFADRFREPARARAAQLVYRTFLLRELGGAVGGRYADQRLRAPTLVLHGRKDPVIRPSMVEGFRAHADDLRIDWVDDAGHFIVDERPELVRDRLVTWFSRGA